MITDPKTGEKFVRRVPIKKGATLLFNDRLGDGPPEA